jgi:hypothetical protein
MLCGVIRRMLVPIAVLLATVAGCGDGTGSKAAPSRVPTTAAALPPAPSLSPSSAGPTIHPLGQDVTVVDSGNGDPFAMTAYGYKQPTGTSATAPDQAGYVWASADVKICAGRQTLTVSHHTWVLVYDDASSIEASSTGYSQFQQPEFPWGDTQIAPGRCQRGWITYPVPRDKRPTMIEHRSEGTPTVDWRVS